MQGNLTQSLLPARGTKELEKHMKVLAWRLCRQARRAVSQHLAPHRLLPPRPASYVASCQAQLLFMATLHRTAAVPLAEKKKAHLEEIIKVEIKFHKIHLFQKSQFISLAPKSAEI